jgi:UPF0176 protein
VISVSANTESTAAMNVTTDPSETKSHVISGPFLNVAAYKFAALTDRVNLRQQLKAFCLDRDLKGTILLSTEGINLFICGTEQRVHELMEHLREVPGLNDLEGKFSYSDKVPFRRMLVRLKNEIIPCGLESIQPEQRTSPKLTAKELKTWLDEGKRVRLLDVRNNYEVELGTFEGAEQLDLGHFREFPDALQQLADADKDEPVVMFCTGGIRCEKAGPVMEQAGFKQVYQLDGGILKYFEECGDAHYDGSCFVFDGRVALDAELKPTGNLLCFACQAVLGADDVASGKFKFGEYCPKCYVEPEALSTKKIENRQARIFAFASEQPGSEPYTNRREIHVAGRFGGLPLIDFLDRYQPRIGREQWMAWLEAGNIVKEDGGPCSAEESVREGQRLIQHMPNTIEPKINPDIRLIHEDEALVVLNKPAPLPCHPGGRFNRNTLLSLVSKAYPNEKLRLPHRLDAMTTGVIVLPRKYRPARQVQAQFESHSVGKTYLARVHGVPEWTEQSCTAAIATEPCNELGAREVREDGKSAETHFRRLAIFADQTSLVEARPITGRTNQIRIHLKELGLPIVGDTIYGQTEADADVNVFGGDVSGEQLDRPAASSESATQASSIRSNNPLCLHAWKIELDHPTSGERVCYEAPKPDWSELRD